MWAPHLGRQTLFSWKKTGDLFLVTIVCQLSDLQCHLYLFSPEKLATFSGHHCRLYSFDLFTRVSHCRSLFPACCYVAKIFCCSVVGAPFVWGPCLAEHAEHAQICHWT